jgi:hypothetical protein
MTLTAQENPAASGREPGRCRYPGCPNQARAAEAPGRPPGYCGQDVPEDRDGTAVLVRHTAMTAFRRRAQLTGQPGDGRPVTAAISRAGAIRDDALAAMGRLSGQLAAAIDQLAVLGEQLAAAGDPEAAEAQAEAVRAETAAADAWAAAAEAIAMMEAQAAGLARAQVTARDAAQAFADGKAAHASELAAARAQADDAARGREQDRARTRPRSPPSTAPSPRCGISSPAPRPPWTADANGSTRPSPFSADSSPAPSSRNPPHAGSPPAAERCPGRA